MSGAAELARLLDRSERVFVLSGAGLSTDSGIGDFRGPRGLYTRNPAALRMFDLEAYRADRALRVAAWQQRLGSEVRGATPNVGHRMLAVLQQQRRVTIATQNIDGLHQRAGATGVIELHGTFWRSRCLDCGTTGDIEEVFGRLSDGEEDPACLICGGILRTSTVGFGQALDPDTWRAATTAASSAELAIAIGTSLAVQPAASLCKLAAASGAALAILNDQPTPYDGLAALVIRDSISPTLASAARELRLPLS